MGTECFEQGIRHKFECGLCDFICTESGAFNAHIQEKHRCKFLPCKKCDKLYNVARPLINHIEAWHYQFSYRCGDENCTFEAFNRNAFQLHLKASHVPEFPCKYCKQRFSTIQKLLVHWRVLKACDDEDCRHKKEKELKVKKAEPKLKKVPKVKNVPKLQNVPKLPDNLLKFVSIQPKPSNKSGENDAVTSKPSQTNSKIMPIVIKKSVKSIPNSSLSLPSVQSKLCVVNGSVSHLTFPITSIASKIFSPGHANKNITTVMDPLIKVAAPVSCQPIKIVKTKMVQKSQSRHADDLASFFVFTESKTSPTPVNETTNVSENSMFLKVKNEDIPVNASDESTLPQICSVKSEAVFDCLNDLNPELPVSDDFEMSIERSGETDFKVFSVKSKPGNQTSDSQVEHSMKTLFSLADIEQLAESKSDVYSVSTEVDISNIKVEPEDDDTVETVIKSEPVEDEDEESLSLITDGEIEESCSTFPSITEDTLICKTSLFEVCESGEIKNEICNDFQHIKEVSDDLALENTSTIFPDQCKKICVSNSDIHIIDHGESFLKDSTSNECQDVTEIERAYVSNFDSSDFVSVSKKFDISSKSLVSASTDPVLKISDIRTASDYVKEENYDMETDSDSSNDSVDRLVIDEDDQDDGGRNHQVLAQTANNNNISDAGVLDLGVIFKHSHSERTEKDVAVSMSSDQACLPEIENDNVYSSDTEVDIADIFSCSSTDEDDQLELTDVTGTSVTKSKQSEVPSITAFSPFEKDSQEKTVNVSTSEKSNHQEIMNIAASFSSSKEIDNEIDKLEEIRQPSSSKASESTEISNTAQLSVSEKGHEARISNVKTSVPNYESILKKLVVKVVPLRLSKKVVKVIPLPMPEGSIQKKTALNVAYNPLSISKESIQKKAVFNVANNPLSISKESILKKAAFLVADNPLSVSKESIQKKAAINAANNPLSISKETILKKAEFLVADNPLSISKESIQKKAAINAANNPLSISKESILKKAEFLVADNPLSISKESIQKKAAINAANNPLSISKESILKKAAFLVGENSLSVSKEIIKKKKPSFKVTIVPFSISKGSILKKAVLNVANNPLSISKEIIQQRRTFKMTNKPSISMKKIFQENSIQKMGKPDVAINPPSISKEDIQQMEKLDVANNPLSISKENIQQKKKLDVANNPPSVSKESIQEMGSLDVEKLLSASKGSVQKKVTFNVANYLDHDKEPFCEKTSEPLEHCFESSGLTVHKLLKKYRCESDFPVKRKPRSKPGTFSEVQQLDQSVRKTCSHKLSLLNADVSETSPSIFSTSSDSFPFQKETEFASYSDASESSYSYETSDPMAEVSSFQTIPVVVTASSKQPLVTVLSTSLPRVTASSSKLPIATATKKLPLIVALKTGLNVATSSDSSTTVTDSGSGSIMDVSSCKSDHVITVSDSIMPLEVGSKPGGVPTVDCTSPALTVSNSVTVARSVSSPIISCARSRFVTVVSPKMSAGIAAYSRSPAFVATGSNMGGVITAKSPVTVSSSTVSLVSMTNTVSSVRAGNRPNMPLVWVPKDRKLPAVVFNLSLPPPTSTNSASLNHVIPPSTEKVINQPDKKVPVEVKNPIVAYSINSLQESSNILSSKDENILHLNTKTNAESNIFVAAKNQTTSSFISSAVQVPVTSGLTKFTIRTSELSSVPLRSSGDESTVDLHPSLKLLLTGIKDVDNSSNIILDPTQEDKAFELNASSFQFENEECTKGNFKKPTITSNLQYLKYLKQLKYSTVLKAMAQTSNYFKCMLPACSFTSNLPSEFIDHSKLHNVQSVQCTYCLKCVSNAEALVNHAVRFHRRRIFQCSLCFYRACSKVHVSAHIQACHFKKQGSVLIGTPIKLKSEKLPEEEIMFRIDIRQLNCSFESCRYITNSITDMAYHLSQHTSNAIFTCFLCHFKCQSAFDWFLHLKVHNIFLLHCLFCSYGCNKRLQMLNHLTACHADYPLLTYVRTSKHLYFILECFLHSDKGSDSKYIQDCSSPSNCYCYLFSCPEFEGDGNRILKLLENVKTKKFHFKLLECLYCMHRTGFIARMEKHLKQDHCIKTQLQYYHCMSYPLSNSDIRNLFDTNQSSVKANNKPVSPIGEEDFFDDLNALQVSVMERHFASSKIQFKSCDSFAELQVYLPDFISSKQSNLANRILHSFYRVFSHKLKRLHFSCAYCQRRSRTLSKLRLHWKNAHVLSGRKFLYSVNRELMKKSANKCRSVTDYFETVTLSSSCSIVPEDFRTASHLDLMSKVKIEDVASDIENPLSFENGFKHNFQCLSVKRTSQNFSSLGDKRIFKKRKSLHTLDSLINDEGHKSDCLCSSSKCPNLCLCNKTVTTNGKTFSNFCRGPTSSKVNRIKDRRHCTELKLVIFIENFLSHVKIPVSYLKTVLNMGSSVALHNAKHSMLSSLKEYYKSNQT